LYDWAVYSAFMNATATVKVSHRGQLSLPSAARHRWGIQEGGSVGVIDLGGALLLVPGGLDAAREALREAVAPGRYEEAVAEISDPDLAN
jgi:AbrB family looped-hinge helix DNA binding protein